MRMFKSCLMSLAAVALSAALLLVDALAFVAKPVLFYLAEGCHALASGIERFKRDLAHMFGSAPSSGEGLQSGMRREGHGFRQHSAPQYTGQPTA